MPDVLDDKDEFESPLVDDANRLHELLKLEAEKIHQLEREFQVGMDKIWRQQTITILAMLAGLILLWLFK